MHPHDVKLNHDAWRPYQEETIEWAFAQQGHSFLEMPTGSGKTAVATALSSKGAVMALMQTKMLQAENYGAQYGFDILFGKGNYPCVLHGNGIMADECMFAGNMHQCPMAHECEYLQQKAIVQGSHRVALNYAYYFSAKWPRKQGSSYLVMDECDELPEIILDRAGLTITAHHQKRYDLPEFPKINSRAGTGFQDDPIPAALGWLSAVIWQLKDHAKTLEDARPGSKGSKQYQQISLLLYKVQATLEAMQTTPIDWFIRSGPTARTFNYQKQPGFIARPLTARHHRKLWLGDADKQNLMMSATIGEPETLARELGIEEFNASSIPSVWPAESRYIWAPDNAPAIGRKATEKDYVHQAELMAQAIHGCPPDWPGVALMTRKSEAPLVAQRLARYGLEDRVWVPPEVGTDEISRLWEERKRQVPGSIMLSWSHWRGWDGLDEKMLFILKTPFPFLGDEYERERRTYDGKLFFWRTGNMLSQGLGRTRRGRPEDYDTEDECRGIVCLLDKNWRRVQKYIPPYLKESIIS